MAVKQGRIVYIGNIPFEYTEFEVQNIANTVGTVLGIKIAFDQLTGKSKGIAFVEYADDATAASAVRNLKNYQVGSRVLTCGFGSGNSLNDDVKIINPDGTVRTEDDLLTATNSVKIFSNDMADEETKKKRKVDQGIPPLPSGINVKEAGGNAFDLISRKLNSLTRAQLIKLIKDSKEMALRDPALMAHLLDRCPQLSSAIIESLLRVKLKNPDDIATLIEGNDDDDEITVPEDEEEEAEYNPEPAEEAKEENVEIQKTAETQRPVVNISEKIEPEQLEAIKQVVSLTPQQIMMMPHEQRQAIIDIQDNYNKGVYGDI